MHGKIIVLDGIDGTGKTTQSLRLLKQLQQHTDQVLYLSYPNYQSPSSALVQMYLSGELAQQVQDVNAYAASSFYAVDRYATYLKEWKQYYDQGMIIILNRYVSSNAIHQMPKLPQHRWNSFMDWLDDYEHVKLTLPRPDHIFFLDMSHAVADQLILSRYEGDQTKKDLHENDLSYLASCREAAHYAAKRQHWSIIQCCEDDQLLSVEAVFEKILQKMKEVISFL